MLSNNVNVNSMLLVLALAFMLIPSTLDSKESIFFYISLGFCCILLLNTVITAYFRFSRYMVIMFSIFFAHWLFTPDNLLQVSLFVTTMLLFEILKIYDFSYKYIVYPFLAFSAIGFVITLPDMLSALVSVNVGRGDLYKGLYNNANTTSTMSMIVAMSAFLFLKTTYIKKIFISCALISVLATGCRGGILSLCMCVIFYLLLKRKKQKLAFFIFLLFLVVAFLYMVLIEAQHLMDFNYMGKGADSAGRSLQILYVINHFSLNLFGHGKDVINNAVVSKEQFVIHNLYVNSLYSQGLLIVLAYFYYLYHFFAQLTSLIGKAFLLSFHISFFFEPGYCFYYSISIVLVNVLLALKNSDEKDRDDVKYNELMFIEN